jgi:hypothetical protein
VSVRTRLARLPRPDAIGSFLAALGRPTRWSTLRATIDGVIVTTTLDRRGLRPLLAATAGPTAGNRLDPARARAVSEAVDHGLGVIPMAPTCLRRSMTLMRELGRQGLVATVHIGVRTVADRVEAHAWVQAGEEIINDDPALIATYDELVAGELDSFLPMLR